MLNLQTKLEVTETLNKHVEITLIYGTELAWLFRLSEPYIANLKYFCHNVHCIRGLSNLEESSPHLAKLNKYTST